MQSLRDIKKRIKSVKNIAQITKAMEAVSMTKMRKSQYYALGARPFALAAVHMLKNILIMTPRSALPAELISRPVRHSLLVIITADKGLVGGFNENVIKVAETWMHEKQIQKISYSIITVGRKAREFIDRKKILPLKSFTDYGDLTEFKDTRPVADMAVVGFKQKKWDSVDVVYTHFKSTLRQVSKLRTMLPASEQSLEEIIDEIVPESGRFSELRNKQSNKYTYNHEYVFEPSTKSLLEDLVSEILHIAFHHVMLESNASEHSARMVTMKNASDNASEVTDSLNREFNKVRQASITAEISEIIAGADALQ